MPVDKTINATQLVRLRECEYCQAKNLSDGENLEVPSISSTKDCIRVACACCGLEGPKRSTEEGAVYCWNSLMFLIRRDRL